MGKRINDVSFGNMLINTLPIKQKVGEKAIPQLSAITQSCLRSG